MPHKGALSSCHPTFALVPLPVLSGSRDKLSSLQWLSSRCSKETRIDHVTSPRPQRWGHVIVFDDVLLNPRVRPPKKVTQTSVELHVRVKRCQTVRHNPGDRDNAIRSTYSVWRRSSGHCYCRPILQSKVISGPVGAAYSEV